MDNDSLHQRLRRLGEIEVARPVATAHPPRLGSVRPRRFSGSALAVAVTLAGSATAVGVGLAVQPPSSVSTTAPPDAASTAPAGSPRVEITAPLTTERSAMT